MDDSPRSESKDFQMEYLSESDQNAAANCEDDFSDSEDGLATNEDLLALQRSAKRQRDNVPDEETPCEKLMRKKTPKKEMFSLRTPTSRPLAASTPSNASITPIQCMTALTERIEQLERNMMKKFDEVMNELRKMNDGHVKKSTPKGKSAVKVPDYVRTAVRDGYKSGTDSELGWNFSGINSQNKLKFSSTVNQPMTNYIEDFVLGLYGNEERGVIESAIERYYVSMRDRSLRDSQGKTENHRKKMAKNERRKRKLNRRIKALAARSSYDEEKKRRIKDILIMDFMPSESAADSDNDEVFSVKKLTWRTDEATRIFAELDRETDDIMTKRSKRERVKRVRGGGINSARPCPDVNDTIAWAVAQ